jgi:uncharacterized DUF497 family protein
MSDEVVYEFEWDPAKALVNIGKHGVTFDDAATISGSSGPHGL